MARAETEGVSRSFSIPAGSQQDGRTAGRSEQKAKMIYYLSVDEGRKRVLLIAASILAARRLAQWDGRPSPVLESAIADAIAVAERILSKIDARWPAKSNSSERSSA